MDRRRGRICHNFVTMMLPNVITGARGPVQKMDILTHNPSMVDNDLTRLALAVLHFLSRTKYWKKILLCLIITGG